MLDVDQCKVGDLLGPPDPLVGNPLAAVEHWATLVIHPRVNAAV